MFAFERTQLQVGPRWVAIIKTPDGSKNGSEMLTATATATTAAALTVATADLCSTRLLLLVLLRP